MYKRQVHLKLRIATAIVHLELRVATPTVHLKPFIATANFMATPVAIQRQLLRLSLLRPIFAQIWCGTVLR